MKGNVAFITGGAAGIGRATVRAFLEAGVNVALVDRDEAATKATVAELKSIGPGILPIVADLTETARLDSLFESAVKHFGRVDYLINSAALLGGPYDLLEIDTAYWDAVMHLNLKTPMVLTQLFARHVIKRGGGGRIVNMSSSSAFRAQQTRPAYGAAKGGLNVLTRISAAQLGAHDINVNAVAPGITNTPGATRNGTVDVEVLKAKVSEGPNANFLKRLSEPEDIAATILFLCSPGSRQITGQVIQVSAGTITP